MRARMNILYLTDACYLNKTMTLEEEAEEEEKKKKKKKKHTHFDQKSPVRIQTSRPTNTKGAKNKTVRSKTKTTEDL